MLAFIPTPIGNLQDISLRSLHYLANAELIICEDTRVSKKLINLLKEKNQDIEFKKKEYISMHSHNEDELLSSLDRNIFEKEAVYLSDAGMPCVSDPGCKLVRYLQENEIEYEILPGANAALLAYAGSGFCETKFLFFGFLPHSGKKRESALREALNSGYITIIYESPHRIEKLIDELSKLSPNREIFLIKEATKKFEKKIKSTAKELKKSFKDINKKGEWVVVIDAKKEEFNKIDIQDIIDLNIPKKKAAKLIAKISGRSTKECYNELISKKR